MVRAFLDAALTQCGSGDIEAFAEVYDRTVNYSMHLASCWSQEQHAAEEIVLDAYVEIWRTAALFDPLEGSAAAWILSAVHRNGQAWSQSVQRTAGPTREPQ